MLGIGFETLKIAIIPKSEVGFSDLIEDMAELLLFNGEPHVFKYNSEKHFIWVSLRLKRYPVQEFMHVLGVGLGDRDADLFR